MVHPSIISERGVSGSAAGGVAGGVMGTVATKVLTVPSVVSGGGVAGGAVGVLSTKVEVSTRTSIRSDVLATCSWFRGTL